MSSTESASYTKTAKLLHWLIAVAIAFVLVLGWCFEFIPKGEIKTFWVHLHKSVGMTILLLSFVRLGWRWMHQAPPLPDTLSALEKKVAPIVHGLLYLGMIGLPLSGWVLVSAAERPLVLFGVLPVPYLPFLSTFENQKEVVGMVKETHEVAAVLLALLIAAHVAAALKHHFISRDDSLLSMMPKACAERLQRLRGCVSKDKGA